MSQDALSYEELAENIAASAEDSLGDIQKYIITPALLEIIGPVSGKSVLDLYCGAGYLSRRLADLGANVTAVDSSERFIEIAGDIDAREHQGIRYEVAESNDMSRIDDSTFDDIVCNMSLMNIRDLSGTVAELARLIKLGGRFIFSIVHPCFCMPDACWVTNSDNRSSYLIVNDYFSECWWPSEFAGLARAEKKIKHRTLSSYVNALSARGFNVRRISEPRPTPEVLLSRPNLEIYTRLPVALIVEAIFPYL